MIINKPSEENQNEPIVERPLKKPEQVAVVNTLSNIRKEAKPDAEILKIAKEGEKFDVVEEETTKEYIAIKLSRVVTAFIRSDLVTVSVKE